MRINDTTFVRISYLLYNYRSRCFIQASSNAVRNMLDSIYNDSNSSGVAPKKVDD